MEAEEDTEQRAPHSRANNDDLRAGTAAGDDDWRSPGASASKPHKAADPRPPRELLRAVSEFYLPFAPRRLHSSRGTLISADYPGNRGWAAEDGVRELTQNWRDGALEVAKRIWAKAGVAAARGFDDLRFVRCAGRPGDVKIDVYVNGDTGQAWQAPVYLVASYKWCASQAARCTRTVPGQTLADARRAHIRSRRRDDNKGELELVNHAVALDRKIIKLGVSDKGRDARRRQRAGAGAYDDDSSDDDGGEDESSDDGWRDDTMDDDDYDDDHEGDMEADEEMVGKFGEGGKIGIAALAADGYYVSIKTNGQKWEWYFRGSGKRKRKRTPTSDTELFIAKTDLPAPRDGAPRVQDTVVTVRCERHRKSAVYLCGSVPELRAALRLDDGFRFLAPAGAAEDAVRTPRGTLLLHPSAAGAVYVKGVLVCNYKARYRKLVHGYDLPQASLTVDRKQLPDSFDLAGAVQAIWSAAIEAQPKRLAPKYMDMLAPWAAMADAPPADGAAAGAVGVYELKAEEGDNAAAARAQSNYDLWQVQEVCSSGLSLLACRAVAEEFAARFGRDMFAITASASVADRRFVGRQLRRRMVHVAGTLRDILSQAGALEDVQELRTKLLREMLAAPKPKLNAREEACLRRLLHMVANRLLLKPEEVRLVDMDNAYPDVEFMDGIFLVRKAALCDEAYVHSLNLRKCTAEEGPSQPAGHRPVGVCVRVLARAEHA